MRTTSPDSDENIVEWAGLLWKEFEYRHHVYWRSLYLWGGAAVTVGIVPYFRPEATVQLGAAVYIYPLVSLGIAMVGTWHLTAEAERLKLVKQAYDALRPAIARPASGPFDSRSRSWYQQLIAEPIGETVSFLFLVGFAFLTVLNGLLLPRMIGPIVFEPVYVVCTLVVLAVPALVWYRFESRRKRHNAGASG